MYTQFIMHLVSGHVSPRSGAKPFSAKNTPKNGDFWAFLGQIDLRDLAITLARRFCFGSNFQGFYYGNYHTNEAYNEIFLTHPLLWVKFLVKFCHLKKGHF